LAEPAKKRAAPGGKAAFYRLARDWHGYLSAFAFLALLFFSITGVVLNHPEWTRGSSAPLSEKALKLSPAQVAAIKAAKEPGRELAKIAADQVDLVGEYKAGELSGPEIFVRLQSARGSSDLRGNLEMGEIQTTVEKASAVSVLNDLHRGELAGTAWRLLIDVMGAVLIVMSIIGYILFFSLRFRLKTALIVTAVSVALAVGLFVGLVP